MAPIDGPHLEPAHVEEELEEREDWDVEVDLVAGIFFARIQKLSPEQSGQQERVHGQRDDLRGQEEKKNYFNRGRLDRRGRPCNRSTLKV